MQDQALEPNERMTFILSSMQSLSIIDSSDTRACSSSHFLQTMMNRSALLLEIMNGKYFEVQDFLQWRRKINIGIFFLLRYDTTRCITPCRPLCGKIEHLRLYHTHIRRNSINFVGSLLQLNTEFLKLIEEIYAKLFDQLLCL